MGDAQPKKKGDDDGGKTRGKRENDLGRYRAKRRQRRIAEMIDR